MNIENYIKSVQKEVGVTVDGIAGPETWEEIYFNIVGKTISPNADKVDDRSEKNISTLLEKVIPYARALVHAAEFQGITIKVISGTRTYEEQDALYNKGGVTKARGGYSNHNFGIAFDIGVFSGTKYIPESPAYRAVGSLGLSLGLDWGGDWKSFVDEPHFQLRPKWAKDLKEGDMLKELRERKKNNEPVF